MITRIIAAVGLSTLFASGAAAEITVSSKIDTEGGLLGNIIALALEDAGLPVERRLQLGGTQVVREALLSKQIDIYPEYTGNAAFFFNEADSDVWKDAKAAHARAAELDSTQNGVTWLDSAPANNTWAIAVTGPVAEKNNLTTMSDFGAWVSGGGDIKLAASTEFVSSPVYEPTPIVRAEVLKEYPSIPDVLNPIFGGLDMATLQKLNGRIQVGGEPAEAVARDYLTQAGVLD